MRPAFYDSQEYKQKQAAITHKYWQKRTFDFKRKPIVIKICNNPICNTPFQVKPHELKKSCSLRCAAILRNERRLKIKKVFNKCIVCHKNTSRMSSKYCSNQCQVNFQYQAYIIKWQQGLEDGNKGINTKFVSGHIKRYLLEKYSNKCSICGWDKKHPITMVVPLEIDHIDGNSENNKEDNLRLLCPNCHSLTPYFRNLNKGRGRAWRLNK